jgi:hypothetical protein
MLAFFKFFFFFFFFFQKKLIVAALKLISKTLRFLVKKRKEILASNTMLQLT